MSTHPHGPEDPENPQRSRHVIERAEKHDARGKQAQLLIQHDVQRVLAWLGEAPLRTITSSGMREWISQQHPVWTKGYATEIKHRVQDALTEATSATAPEVRARLLHLIDGLIPQCTTYRTGTAPSGGAGEPGGGTIFLRDPETGGYLKEVEHTAVQGYVGIIGKLTGVMAEKHLHLHADLANPEADLSEVPTAELIAIVDAEPEPDAEVQ